MLDDRDERQLVGGGDTLLHYHLADRATNAGLQSDARQRTTSDSAFSVTYDDDFVFCDTTSSNISVTLPLARNGKEFEIVKTASPNMLTILPSGTNTLAGAASVLVYVQWTALRFKAVSGGYVLI